MLKKQSIFLIKNEYKVFGGGELQTALLASLLSKKYNVFIFTSVDELYDYNFNDNIKIIRTKVYKERDPFNIKKFILSFYIYIYNLFVYLYYFLKNRPKIIHFHSNDDLIFTPTILKFIGANIVRTDHADLLTIVNRLNKRQRSFLSSCINYNTKKLIFVSKYYRDTVNKSLNLDKNKVEVVYNAFIKHQELKINQNSGKHDNKVFNIGIMSRLSKEKGIDLAIRSIDALFKLSNFSKDMIKINFFIAGQGDDKQRLKNIADSLKIKVSFLGFISNPYSFLNKLDIFLSLSMSETFGVSILEAMSLGIPTIATAVGGVSELIDNKKNGLLVYKRDCKEIANLINLLIEDNNLRESISEESIIKSNNFSEEILEKNIINIYDTLIKKQ